MEINEMKKNAAQKIILMRNKQKLIKQNLDHMEEQSLKKKIAQAIYYEENSEKGPMLQNKTPVHLRLGAEKVTEELRQPAPTTSENSIVKPRQEITKQRVLIKRNRTLPMDSKLMRNAPKVKIQRDIKRLQNSFTQNNKEKNILQKKIIVNQLPKPRNLPVQVENNPVIQKHTVTGSLNMSLQMKIQLVQSQCGVHVPIVNFPIDIVHSTNVSFNERFSSYP